MIRPFAGIQTIVATPQPVFGSALSAASSLQADQFTGSTRPGNNPSTSTLPMTSIIGFMKNDRVMVGPRGGPYDQGSIFRIDAAALTLTVQGLTKVHAAGELVILNEDAEKVKIIPYVGNAGPVYLGNTPNVSAADPSIFDMMAPPQAAGQPTYVHESDGHVNTSEYWVGGNPGDKFLARFTQK